MSTKDCLRQILGLVCGLLSAIACATEPCRIAFDMGSSGIRSGTTKSSVTEWVNIDYLGLLWTEHGLEKTLAPTIAALRNLPEQGRFSTDCLRVGGGFSAWRLALQQDSEKLTSILARIHKSSGVGVLVISPLQESAYGYFGARQLLGNGLTTSHVLDIGGGSLQIAGESTSYGEALGQKVWHRYLCQTIRNSSSTPCALQPMTGAELEIARTLLAEKLQGVALALPGNTLMTAISRPVSRGVLPAVQRLSGEGAGLKVLRLPAVTMTISQIARFTSAETSAMIGGGTTYVGYLLSDLLLVEGLMRVTGGGDLQVAEIDLNNLSGLLADDRAYAWSRRYDCYLERLYRLGLEAYASDPTTCPESIGVTHDSLP